MIKINIYEIIMQMVNFLILFWMLKKFLIIPVMVFLNKREELLRNDLEAAEKGRLEAEKVINEQKIILHKARQEARDILVRAEEDGGREGALIIMDAKKEAELVVKNAKKDMASEMVNTKEELKNYVGNLAVNLTEKILGQTIDAKAQDKFIKGYLDTVKN